jgi:hypothetical protein
MDLVPEFPSTAPQMYVISEPHHHSPLGQSDWQMNDPI